MWKLASLQLVVAILLGTAVGVAAAEGDQEEVLECHGDSQVEWLRSKDGFFNEKVSFKPRDDTSNALRLFAAEPISKMESLISIPQSAMLTSGGTYQACDTARNLLHEYKLGEDESDYWPYVNYVFSSTRREIFPSSWSKAGITLLGAILGEYVPPWDFSDNTYLANCGIPTNHMLETAFAAVTSRGWGNEKFLVPIFDMIPHLSEGASLRQKSNVDSNSLFQRGQRDVHVFASRDIAAGEELFFSLYECTDCDGTFTYSLPHILKETGIIQSYPRRWYIPFFNKRILFELDEVVANEDDNRKELQLTWLSTRAVFNTVTVSFLQGLSGRLADEQEEFYEVSSRLKSDHERDTVREFYDAANTALHHVAWYAAEQLSKNLTAAVVDDELCSTSDDGQCFADLYDDLEKREIDVLEYDSPVCRGGGAGFVNAKYDEVDVVTSGYQEVKYMFNAELDDTCLYLNNWLQTCSSFRPHYHEAFVHFPARFIEEVKRVVFIGGGDNMILHEILKYPSLELVVGMELDQQVVRSSFKNMGTEAHFDDERVQWWFGDAVKTLQMLPQELYGTFDLVLIDLQTDVSEMLKVADGVSIVDAAVLLMNPDRGILARNEDFYLKTSDAYTDHTVGIYYNDVPIICEQSIYMGSNAVNFYEHAQAKDHDIDTQIFNSVADEGFDRFHGWYDYVSNTTRPHPLCIEPGEDHAVVSYTTADNLGVLMIVEAEAATVVSSSIVAQGAISKALADVGLNEIFVTAKTYDVNMEKGGEDLIFVLQEGYVVARFWPEHEYCAFDVQLWNAAANLQKPLQTALLKSVGSNALGSSYRLVTGGIHGAGNDETEFGRVGPRITEACRPPATTPDESTPDAVTESSELDIVYDKSMSLLQEASGLVLAFCPQDELVPCTSFDAISKDSHPQKAVPIRACSGLDTQESTGALHSSLAACETQALDTMQSAVDMHGKIVGIILDSKTPKGMGQILVKIAQTTQFRTKLVSERFVVLGATIAEDETASWFREVVERFRTDFAMFHPAHKAQVSLIGSGDAAADSKETKNSNPIELSVFSRGDENFFNNVAHVTESIETSSARSNLSAQVNSVKNGIKAFAGDYDPTVTSHDSYDATDPLDQFWSQHPLGHQTIFQFDIDKPDISFTIDDEVYVLHRSAWRPATIVRSRTDGRFTVVLDDEPNTTYHLPTERIRKKTWNLETTATETALDNSELKVALLPAVQRMDSIGFTNAESRIQYDLKDGCVFVLLWSSGSGVLVWDGENHVDVNIFSVTEDREALDKLQELLVSSIPYMKASSRDEQPRGIGRVVNTINEVRQRVGEPHWARTQRRRLRRR